MQVVFPLRDEVPAALLEEITYPKNPAHKWFSDQLVKDILGKKVWEKWNISNPPSEGFRRGNWQCLMSPPFIKCTTIWRSPRGGWEMSDVTPFIKCTTIWYPPRGGWAMSDDGTSGVRIGGPWGPGPPRFCSLHTCFSRIHGHFLKFKAVLALHSFLGPLVSENLCTPLVTPFHLCAQIFCRSKAITDFHFC